MKNILIIGSLNMDTTIYCDDFPLNGETIYGNSIYVQAGGKGLNQAVALSKTKQVNVSFLGSIANDNNGTEIRRILSNYNIDSKLKISSYPTGNATIIVNKNGENKIIIIGGANSDLKICDISLDLIKNADYILLQNEIPQDVNDYIVEIAYKLNKIIVYNPAPYRDISNNTLSKITYFIPNEGELLNYSKKDNVDDGLNALLENGIKNIIVTLGSNGSRFKNLTSDFIVEAFKTKVEDTVAAGDTFVGYFISFLANDYSVKQAMTYASKASSITVSRRGSLVSIPVIEEINI